MSETPETGDDARPSSESTPRRPVVTFAEQPQDLSAPERRRITFREVDSADGPLVLHLLQSAYQGTTIGPDKQIDFIREMLDDQPGSFIAYVGEESMGYMLFSRSTEPGTVELYDMGIAEMAKSNKMGRREPRLIGEMVRHMASMRIDGQPARFTAWVREGTTANILRHPGLQRRLLGLGYAVEDMQRRYEHKPSRGFRLFSRPKPEVYHRIALNPVQHGPSTE